MRVKSEKRVYCTGTPKPVQPPHTSYTLGKKHTLPSTPATRTSTHKHTHMKEYPVEQKFLQIMLTLKMEIVLVKKLR